MGASQDQGTISEYAANLIRHKARQLVGKAGFTESDREDLEQEMQLDLVKRLPKFDPDKASEKTFVTRLIERKISRLIRHRTCEMRDHRRESSSLNGQVDDPECGTIERGNTVGEDRTEVRLLRRRRTQEEATRLRLDVEMVLSALPDDLRQVAERLMAETIAQAAVSLDRPRSTITDARNRLRAIFENAGLHECL